MKSFALFALVLILGSTSYAGNSVGNAGDITAMEFSWTAALALKRLRESVLTSEQTAQLAAIEAKIKVVRVTSLPKLSLKGVDVNAINYPKEDLIEVSQEGWSVYKKSTAVSRLGFVLHEYLGVAGFDDAGYKLSKALTDRIRDERFADVAFEENLLNALWSLSFNMHMASLRTPPAKAKKDDTKSYCFSAGRIRGQSLMLSMLISSSTNSISGSNSEKALQQIADGSREIEIFCERGHIYQPDLKAAVENAIEGIHSIANSISANVAIPRFEN